MITCSRYGLTRTSVLSTWHTHFIKQKFHSSLYRTVKRKDSEPQTAHRGRDQKLKSTLYYLTAAGVLTVGFSYAAVPLYRMFCQGKFCRSTCYPPAYEARGHGSMMGSVGQKAAVDGFSHPCWAMHNNPPLIIRTGAYSYGGTVSKHEDSGKIENMEKKSDRIIKVKFNADLGASMRWNFKPQQNEIKVPVGETALAFYTARNPTDTPVIGISTYNVVPYEAGQYFNKIQCFCFEEQQLNPHEEVDMPVFFYIDPEFSEDPKMELVDTIVLSYTFFEAKEGLKLPVPSFVQKG